MFNIQMKDIIGYILVVGYFGVVLFCMREAFLLSRGRQEKKIVAIKEAKRLSKK